MDTVELLADDLRSLSQCCLTCRTWARFALRLLETYGGVVNSRQKAERYIKGMQVIPESKPLCIYAPDDPRSWCSAFGIRVASYLGQLEELILHDFDLGVTHSTFLACLRGWKELKSLDITSCVFPTFSLFLRLITSFPHMRKLHLRDITWKQHLNATAVISSRHSHRFKITELHITGQQDRSSNLHSALFVNWLVNSTSCLSELKALQLRQHVSIRDDRFLQIILEACSNLQELHVFDDLCCYINAESK